MNMLKIYFSFKGRLSLKRYWAYWNIPAALLFVTVTYLNKNVYLLNFAYWQIVNVFIIWPALATAAKRLHDIDKTAWWLLLNLVPVFGSVVVSLATSFIPGLEEPNRFGTR